MQISTMLKALSALLFALLLVASNSAHADGWTFRNGRFPEGKVTVLKLTKEQKDFSDYVRRCFPGKPPYNTKTPYIFKLTQKQSDVLKREAGLSPQRFALFESYRGDNSVDLEVNVVNRFSNDEIEIPHKLLTPDEEAVDWQANIIGWEPNPIDNLSSHEIRTGACIVQDEALSAASELSLPDLKQKAEQGNAKAQLSLGDYYGLQFVTCDPAVSAEYWEKSHIVAICSSYRDAPQAAIWYRKAAEQDNKLAQYKLAALYVHGAGVKQDYSEAYFWFSLSKKSGFRPRLPDGDLEKVVEKLSQNDQDAVKKRVGTWTALVNMSDSASLIAEVKKGSSQALMAIQKAAGHGDTAAQEALCYSLFPSKHQAAPSQEVAVKWCRHLAEKGHPEVQRFLGLAYSFGRGMKQDYAEAYFWYKLAEKSGSEPAVSDASRALRHVIENLRPEQMREIDKRVESWKPQQTIP